MSSRYNKIPVFPKFKKLELNDQEAVESFIKNHPPYSDYNFVSLWSYNTQEKIEVSNLNANLVIKFQDYLSDEFFLSFIGHKKLTQTIDSLLESAKKQKVLAVLKLVPEHNILDDKEVKSKYLIEEDMDNFDYILSVDDLVDMKGNKFRGRRNFVNRFKKLYPDHGIKKLDLNHISFKKEIENLFFLWEKQTGKSRRDTENELKALQRLLKSSHKFNLHAIGIYITHQLIAFSIEEIVHDNHGIIHFEKANAAYTGIYQYLKHLTARHFKEMGVKFINYEQDLGLEGLRRAKRSYNPVHFLKKYIISVPDKKNPHKRK